MKRKKKAWDFENCFGHLAKIEWVDSSALSGWHGCDTDNTLIKIKSVGFIVVNGKQAVTISTSISERVNFLDKLTIPRVNIRKMATFGVVTEKRRKKG